MGKVFIGLLITCTFIGKIYAQREKLSLSESIEIASDSSLQAFRAKNLYLSGYWQYRSYKAARLPSLTLRTTPIRYNRDFVRRYDSENNIDIYRQQQSLFSSGNVSISQNFDLTGGTFFIDSELGYFQNLGGNEYSQFSSVPIRVGYSQSLFGFNGFKWERKIEPLKYEKVKKQFIYAKEEISEAVVNYFFALAMAQLEYDMAKETVSSSDTLYKIGQERHHIASISQADLLTLRLDAVNARNTFRTAESNLKKAMFRFVSFLNLDKTTEIQPELPGRPHKITLSADLAMRYAREHNPDYLAFKQEILESEREVDRTKKSSSFDASVSISVGFNQVANDLKSVYKNPLEQDIVGVGLTIPLVDWGVRKGRANMAQNELNVARISVQQKEVSLEQEIIMTVDEFNIRQDLISSAEEALGLATLAYKVTRERFIIGKADLNSLTLSLNRQNTAQRNYIATLQDYWNSYYRLRKLTLYDFVKNEPLTVQFDSMLPVR